ncbi:MAG TPA: exonuclease subunit SbcD [Aquifex sp.]|nr:exonuclease subunit SbcD [Aquifex sp.]
MSHIRLIHIADLHAGKTNDRRLNRNEDLKHALDQILDFARENRPHYAVVAGDIFDKKLPDAESISLITEFFIKLSRLGVKVVAIGGNHDSALFLRSQTHWAEHFDIKLFPSLDRKNFVFRDGDVAFVCIPFVSERGITDLSEGSDRAKIQYGELMRKLILHGLKQVENVPYKVLVGHLYFAGSKLGNTEVEVTVTDSYALSQSALPPEFDYVALGHVHRYQRLEASPAEAYYTGSLYQLDFGEAGQEKFFNYVVLEDNRARVEKVKLSLLRELKKVTLKRGQKVSDLAKELNKNTYYWVNIEASTPQEFLLKKQEVERVFGDNLLRVYPLGLSNRRRKLFRDPKRDLEKLKNPIEMYREYLKSLGREWNGEVEDLLKGLMGEITA